MDDRQRAAAVYDVIRQLMDAAHPELPELERDHQSLMLTTKCMAEALPGSVEHIRRIEAIGRHSVCEFTVRRGDRTLPAYAALEAL